MKNVLFVIIAIFTGLFILSCDHNNNSGNIRSDSLSVVVDILITKQTESHYRSFTRKSANAFDIYPSGSYELKSVPAPKSFRELAIKLRTEWTVPSVNYTHPIVKFLAELNRKSPLHYTPEAIRRHNLRSLMLGYALLSGIVQTDSIMSSLNSSFGPDLDGYLDDPDMHIEWPDRCDSLLVFSKTIKKSIPVSTVAHQPYIFTQKINPVDLSFEQIKLFEKEYSGTLQVMDNALGKILGVFVFYNRTLPYKTLLALCRTLDEHIYIVTLPRTRLLYYIDSYIQSIELGRPEWEYTERILKERCHLSSIHAKRIFAFCTENAPEQFQRDRQGYISRWEKLRDDVYFEKAGAHKRSLEKQLSNDGLDSKKVTVISARHLESHWAREYFLLGNEANGRPLFIGSSLHLDKRNTELVTDLLGNAAFRNKWGACDIRLPFEGGDIRAIGPNLFMGENIFGYSIEKTARYMQTNAILPLVSSTLTSANEDTIAAAIRKEYTALFGREFVVTGEDDGILQAMTHIDMFLTFLPNPGGKPTVVVADLEETVRILDGLTEEEKAQAERSILCASLTPDELGNASENWLLRGQFMRHDLIDFIVHEGLDRYLFIFQISEKAKVLQQRLDAAAQWFEKRGYPVARAPTAAISAGYCNFWSQKKGIARLEILPENAERAYNNALVEVYLDNNNNLKRTVYLPRYGLVPLEKRLVEIYNSLGYRVFFIPFMWEVAYGGGALNCITTEIRKPFREKIRASKVQSP